MGRGRGGWGGRTAHLLLEEVLPVLEGPQPVLPVLVLQVLGRRVQVADQVPQAQADRLDGQVHWGRLRLPAQSIQAPK